MTPITSPETLDAAAADLVRARIALTQAKADMEAEAAAVQKRHQARIVALTDDCADREQRLAAYCDAHRAEIFPAGQKSRETPLATFGFRASTWVETINRKIKWADVVERLQRLVWGENYLTYKPPVVNKEALHADRASLTPEALAQAGIRFVTEDKFYFDPKPETAAAAGSADSPVRATPAPARRGQRGV